MHGPDDHSAEQDQEDRDRPSGSQADEDRPPDRAPRLQPARSDDRDGADDDDRQDQDRQHRRSRTLETHTDRVDVERQVRGGRDHGRQRVARLGWAGCDQADEQRWRREALPDCAQRRRKHQLLDARSRRLDVTRLRVGSPAGSRLGWAVAARDTGSGLFPCLLADQQQMGAIDHRHLSTRSLDDRRYQPGGIKRTLNQHDAAVHLPRRRPLRVRVRTQRRNERMAAVTTETRHATHLHIPAPHGPSPEEAARSWRWPAPPSSWSSWTSRS